MPLGQLQEAWDILASESANLNVNVEPILKYFENTWIKGDFLPEEWNQFDVLNDRTNNNVEGYNSKVNKKLRTKPNLLKFCDFMKAEENKMAICHLQSNKEPYYLSKSTKIVFNLLNLLFKFKFSLIIY